MAYNVFYTSVPVLISVLNKDLSEETVMQHPQTFFNCQAGRLLNPTFAGWFGRSLFHAAVVIVISIHAYAYERSEMEEVAIVALSSCMWLQAFCSNNGDQLTVAARMGPILAIKYFRFTYTPSKINTLQQAERMGGLIVSLGPVEPHPRSIEKDVSTLTLTT